MGSGLIPRSTRVFPLNSMAVVRWQGLQWDALSCVFRPQDYLHGADAVLLAEFEGDQCSAENPGLGLLSDPDIQGLKE